MNDKEQYEPIVRLIAQHQRRLLLYIRSLVPHRADAEEVLQEVTLFIWRHADEYRPGTDFAAWAYKIAYYQVLTHRKRQARQKLQFSDALVEQLAETAAAAAEMTDRRQEALERCLQKLGEQDRELVRLRYEAGATAQDVAEQLGRSVKTVYRTLNRIHLGLLECIQRTLRLEAGT